jgi:hypothetical protein
MKSIKDTIVNFYKHTDLIKNLPPTPDFLKEESDYTLLNYNFGVGDSLALYLFDKPEDNKKNINFYFNKSIAEEFNIYNSYINSVFSPNLKPKNFWVCLLQSNFNCGGGHFIQKIRNAFDLPKQIKPQPLLSTPILEIKNKVVLTFDKGPVDQSAIHKKARLLYPEHKKIVQDFINKNLNKFSFVEVGRSFSGLENVENKTNLGIQNTTAEIASCEYFFGIHNGLMHIAAALSKKSIIIINFPSAKHLYLPALKELNIPDQDWLYPQNVHLHQDEGGELVKQFTYTNIEKAFNGEVYPFWSESFLDLHGYE